MGSGKNKARKTTNGAKRKMLANRFRLTKLRKSELIDNKPAEPVIEYPVRSEDWLSCQIDINKLVQPNNLIDEKILPTKSILPTEANDVAETKNILPAQTNYIIDEEFVPEEKCLDIKLIDIDEKKDVSPIDVDEWVLEQNLCRCCHAEGAFSSLQDTAPSEHITYNDMLTTCFNIQLFPVSGGLSAALGAVCGLCAARMRDAHSFSEQVRASEARLLHLYQRNCIKVATTIHIEVKEELNEDDNNDADFEISSYETSEQLPDKEDVTMATPEETPERKDIKKTPTQKSKNTAKTRNALHKPSRKKPIPSPQFGTRVGDSYKCTQCDKTYRNGDGIREHFKRIHQNFVPKIKCPHCIKTFATRRLLTVHKLDEHDIDERFRCNACDKVFNAKKQISVHMNTYHMMGERITCSKCDYVCYDKHQLKKHLVKHNTTKDFSCKYCKKSFLRKTTLAFHERIHTGDKRKACAVCGQAFVQKASLNYHMAKHHPEVKF